MKTKLCPFRTKKEIIQYHWENDTCLPSVTIDEFLPCLKEQCIAYKKVSFPFTKQICKLVKNKNKTN